MSMDTVITMADADAAKRYCNPTVGQVARIWSAVPLYIKYYPNQGKRVVDRQLVFLSDKNRRKAEKGRMKAEKDCRERKYGV